MMHWLNKFNRWTVLFLIPSLLTAETVNGRIGGTENQPVSISPIHRFPGSPSLAFESQALAEAIVTQIRVRKEPSIGELAHQAKVLAISGNTWWGKLYRCICAGEREFASALFSGGWDFMIKDKSRPDNVGQLLKDAKASNDDISLMTVLKEIKILLAVQIAPVQGMNMYFMNGIRSCFGEINIKNARKHVEDKTVSVERMAEILKGYISDIINEGLLHIRLDYTHVIERFSPYPRDPYRPATHEEREVLYTVFWRAIEPIQVLMKTAKPIELLTDEFKASLEQLALDGIALLAVFNVVSDSSPGADMPEGHREELRQAA